MATGDVEAMVTDSVGRDAPARMLRLKQVLERTGLGKTTIYELQKSALFPHSVPLTARSVRWLESEVDAWLAKRAGLRHPTQVDNSNPPDSK
jgi:prophage regulatory protein